jgi:hypothetical protein
MKTKKIVAFAAPEKGEVQSILDESNPPPMDGEKKPKWQDLVLKKEHQSLAGKLEKGPNWLRILPGLQLEDGISPPFLEFQLVYFPGGRYALPGKGWGAVGKIFNSLKEAGKTAQFKEAGLNYPSDSLAFLAIRKGHNGDSLGVYIGGGNDGTRGGQIGWARNVLNLQTPKESTEPGAPAIEPVKLTDPANGVRVNVEKLVPESKDAYPTYRVTPGTVVTPIMGAMEAAGVGMEDLVPLVELIHFPDEVEQFEILEKAGIPSEIIELGKAYQWKK